MGSHVVSGSLIFFLLCGQIHAVLTQRHGKELTFPHKSNSMSEPSLTSNVSNNVIECSNYTHEPRVISSVSSETNITSTAPTEKHVMLNTTKQARDNPKYKDKIASNRRRRHTLYRTQKTLHIPQCLSGANVFHFPVLRLSRLRIVKEQSNQNTTFKNCVGSLVADGPYIFLRSGTFELSGSCADFYSKQVTLTINKNINVRPCERYVVFYSSERKVEFSVRFLGKTKVFNLSLYIKAHTQNYRRILKISHYTRVSGTMTPYGFDGITDYPVSMDAWGHVRVPTGRSVMVSFRHFLIRYSENCHQDVLLLEVNRIKTWSRCGHQWALPETYHGSLRFRFISKIFSRYYSGFKIRYSLHIKSELPEKRLATNDNTAIFNCSVPFYLQFKQHLVCNLDTECVHGEDEASCPYSLGACNPGFLNAGEMCYKYHKFQSKRMTWYDASAVCLKQGLTLASFHTFRQEEEFRDELFQFSHPVHSIYIGLRTSDPLLRPMYRDAWQWTTGVMAYNYSTGNDIFKPTCAKMSRLERGKTYTNKCGCKEIQHFLFCETEASVVRKFHLPHIELYSAYSLSHRTRTVKCPEGHVTHDFLSCDYGSRCGEAFGLKECVTKSLIKVDNTQRSVHILMYVCSSQSQTIHYTSLCDFVPQCIDSSDESFCIHQACSHRRCLNGQCVSAAQWCDGMANCVDGSDEACPRFVIGSGKPLRNSMAGFHVVLFDGYGKYRYVPQGSEFPLCPPTHFLCANRELCLPVYVRCNGVYDCPYRDDEGKCDDVTCPGYYRCRDSTVCVHADHMCDGVFQCPQQDDELHCQLVCPDNCLCQGLAFVCKRSFSARAYSELRYLDASQSGLTPDQLFHNHYLIRLVLAKCRLRILPELQFPNLKFLDLSNNIITNVGMLVFLKLSNIGFITLSRNPLTKLVTSETNTFLENVYSIDLSQTKLKHFDGETLSNIRNLKYLNLSHNPLSSIGPNGFGSSTQIKVLDLRGTDLKDYPLNMLKSMSSLHELFSDVYKLCCPDILPDKFNIQNCHTSPDELSSCKDLLRSELYRMFLWMSCILALIGNAGSFAAKICMQRGKPPNSFNVFICNLNIADFFMGLYLAVIGSTDQTYRGRYLWHDEEWKTSAGCKPAGLMSLLSCEMSAFIICFITLDRVLVMRFPFSQIRFSHTSAKVACVLGWVTGVGLVSVPLLPMMSHWKFFSQTDICIPLPVTRQNFKGRHYSFGILIVLNFILFVFIAVGQLSIYKFVRMNSMITDQKSGREATVARRLLTVVMSDFLCWFPIGLLGLLASNGVSIPGEVNVAMAIFVLPLNSALNPFLYTFNLIMERRRKASEERLLKFLQTRIS